MNSELNDSSEQTPIDPDLSLSKSWSIGTLRPWLMLLARQQTSPSSDASDIVQQTLTQAWQNESKAEFNSTAERLAWLRAILVNTVRRQRRDRHTIRRGGDIEHERLDETKHLPMSQQVAAKTHPVIRAEESLRLSEAIAKLPDDQRHVVTRHQFDEADYETIATELNRSIEATRMLKVRALRSLKVMLRG